VPTGHPHHRLSSFTPRRNAHHFDATLFSAKPHPGRQQVAAWLRSDLPAGQPHRNEKRLQDRYSMRCAPHVIGVLNDACHRCASSSKMNSTAPTTIR
jgi:histidine ammonia-lyase